MKNNRHLVVVLCMGFFLAANAQKEKSEDRRENVEIGAKVGFNISNVWDSQGQEFTADSKAGFAGGIFISIPFDKIVGLQPEVLISQKGFKGSGTVLGYPYSTTRTTTYLDIPVQLQIKPIEAITFLVGPQFSYLLNQKDVYTFGANSTLQEQEFDNDNIRKNILGFVIGADLIYKNIVVSGRAGWDFQNNNGDGTATTPRYKNQWLQLTTGLKI